MKCPKCGSKHIDIDEGHTTDDYVTIEAYCKECEDVVAFFRIHNEDWLIEDL